MKIFFIILLFLGNASMTDADETNATTDTIFRQYDDVWHATIFDHWKKLFLEDKTPSTPPPLGEVDLKFRLYPDGHVSDLKVDCSTVDEKTVALDKKAIMDSTPFACWTKEIRQAYTNDFRVVHYAKSYGIIIEKSVCVERNGIQKEK